MHISCKIAKVMNILYYSFIHVRIKYDLSKYIEEQSFTFDRVYNEKTSNE